MVLDSTTGQFFPHDHGDVQRWCGHWNEARSHHEYPASFQLSRVADSYARVSTEWHAATHHRLESCGPEGAIHRSHHRRAHTAHHGRNRLLRRYESFSVRLSINGSRR